MGDKMSSSLKKYCRIWARTTYISLARELATLTASMLFLVGKIIRFGLFLYLLTVLEKNVSQSFGYASHQLFLFYLVFNFFDSLGQIFFRGIYWFRQQVISGEFDFRLTKPVSPLFQVLTRETDLLDIPLLVMAAVLIMRELWVGGVHINVVTLVSVTLASLLLITAVHISVAAFGLLTSEVDHLMWVYRDLSQMARFPIDVYGETVRAVLTFIFPVGIIFTVPAKAMMGLLSTQMALLSLTVSLVALGMSLGYWKAALKQYSSASS